MRWTSDEIKLLEDNYPYMDYNDLEKLFNYTRSKSSINNKANELKLNKFKKQTKEGYQICKKCKRELPLDYKFFPKLKSEKNFRQVCRECNHKYGRFLDDDYIIKKQWTKEEEIKFIELYPNYTNEILIKEYYPNLTNKQLWDKAWNMGICKNEEALSQSRINMGRKLSTIFKGRKFSEEHKQKISITKKKTICRRSLY